MRGRSTASDNWKSFPKGPHSFFDEGFVHDKTLTFKAKMQNENDGVTIKETIIEKTEGLSGAGEIEVWIAADAERTFSAKIGTTSYLNLQFDNGVRSFKRIKQNLYAGLEVNRSFTENFGRVGLELFKDDIWSINNRFVYNISRAGLSWDGKAYYSWRNWKLNAQASVEMGNKPALGQMGLLLRWSPAAKDTLYLQFERKGSNQTPVRALTEGLTLGCNSAVSQTQTVGIETRINLSGLSWKNPLRNLSSVWLGSQWQVNDTKVKVKVRTDLSHAITVTNKLGSYGQYSLGMELTQVGSKNKFKFGTQISLNL